MQIQKLLGIYLAYTMYILFKFSGYTVQNSLTYMVYAWYMSCIYKKNSWDILGIYNVYPIQISWIYSAKFSDMHGIFMIYSMHISSIYIYDIKNLPCSCTCHVQFHLDSAVALALFPTQCGSPVCL